jgi:hypothetical protein
MRTILLEKEYKVYCDHLDQFLSHHRNKYVLIKDQKVIGFYGSYEGALKSGLEKFGNVPFFLKMVCETEKEVNFFRHNLSF